MILLDPDRLVREAEAIRQIKDAYEASPETRLPTLITLQEQKGLEEISPVLKTYLENLKQARELFLDPEKAEGVRKKIARYNPITIEQSYYGLVAQCEEDIFFTNTEPAVHSEFFTYPSCMILVADGIDGRAILHWEFTDCSQPEGCARITDPGVAVELLHHRNYLLPHQVCTRINDQTDFQPKMLFDLAQTALHSYLCTRMASGKADHNRLINEGYLPLRNLLREFRELVPEIRDMLDKMDYIIESTIIELNSALTTIPPDVLCPIIANMPLDDIAVNLPEVRKAYAEYQARAFRQNLESTKKQARELDSLFDDEQTFDSLIRDALL